MINILTCKLAGNVIVIPDQLANVIATIYDLLKIGVPLLLILFGMLDLGKSVIAQKEDEIKKSQDLFIKRLIAAALVFFVFAIVQLLVSFVGGDDSESIMGCIKTLLGVD